ncbi:MAG: amidohydrolase family protein [Alphaproteobacteria bacterium]|nr:amidohydrolase family protein [Alphaproteobacteria bacterium]
MDYDLRIAGGTIVDGSGRARYRGDLGVNAGRIVAVGAAPGSAAMTIEADGAIVAPGFIDIHTHYDAQVMWDPRLTVSPWHGVTTVVMGNCGFGVAPAKPEHRRLLMQTLENVEGMSLAALEAGLAGWPFESFPDYLDAIAARGTAINVGAMIGHSAVRLDVMGLDAVERPARADEVEAMAAIVGRAVAAGALGFSTSTSRLHVGFAGKPVPSRFADMNGEIIPLAAAVGRNGGGVAQITTGIEPTFEAFEALARAAGRVSWTALLTRIGDDTIHERHRRIAADQHTRALPIHPQVSCRPLMMEFQFAAPFPFERLDAFKPASAADRAGKARLYADPAFRAALRHELREGAKREPQTWALQVALHGLEIADAPTDRALVGRRVDDLAAERGADPLDLALDLALASGLEARFRIPLANTNEAAIGALLNDPFTVIGLSDAGAHTSQLCDACFATDLLGRWVRDKSALTLEQAIDQLCVRPARIFGLAGRGRIAPGMAADIVVFDPATIGAAPLARVRDLPAGADRLIAAAEGVRAVIVNGTPIRIEGRDVEPAAGALPGRVLRRSG